MHVCLIFGFVSTFSPLETPPRQAARYVVDSWGPLALHTLAGDFDHCCSLDSLGREILLEPWIIAENFDVDVVYPLKCVLNWKSSVWCGSLGKILI